jgi:anti-sigma regulatory factor (Ser/Thr protein kinase)
MNVWDVVGTVRLRANPRVVRAYVRDVLADDAGRVDVADVELMTSEITTNAALHSRSGASGGGLQVTVLRSTDRVRLEFQDDGGGDSMPRIPESAVESGRGLQIVDALSSDWGWSIGAGDARRLTVWFEVTFGGGWSR